MWTAEIKYRALSGEVFQCLIIPDVTLHVTFILYSHSETKKRVEVECDIPSEMSRHIHEDNTLSLFPPNTFYQKTPFAGIGQPHLSYLCLMGTDEANTYMRDAEEYCKKWLSHLTTDFTMSVRHQTFRDPQNSMNATKKITIRTNPKRICR